MLRGGGADGLDGLDGWMAWMDGWMDGWMYLPRITGQVMCLECVRLFSCCAKAFYSFRLLCLEEAEEGSAGEQPSEDYSG